MNTPKETAEVIFIVIKRIIKWVLIASISLVLGVVVIIKISELYDYQTEGKYQEQVIIKANYPERGECTKDYPYEYIILNESEKTIEKVHFNVGIRKKGFSNEINEYTSIDEYKIIKPNEGWGSCFRVRSKDFKSYISDKDVDVVVTYRNVTFLDK
jgi:hypothetical protein